MFTIAILQFKSKAAPAEPVPSAHKLLPANKHVELDLLAGEKDYTSSITSLTAC